MANPSFIERSGVQVMDRFSAISEALRTLASREVRVVEINLNNPRFLKQLDDAAERAEIARITVGEGISWMAHLPEDLAFFEIDEDIFEGYLNRQVELQKKAGEAGCEALTAHMGAAPHFAWSGQRRPGVVLFSQYYRQTLRRRLQQARGFLSEEPFFCFENVGGFHLEFVREILDGIGWNGYTMDIGHLKVAHRRIADAEFEFYKKNVDSIRVVHVHDNDGEWDMHLPVTETGALQPYLELAEESDAYLIMEVRPLEGALSSLAVLTGIQRNL